MGYRFGDTRLPPRFWSKALIYPGTQCWLWQGSLTRSHSSGYGNFSWQGRTHGAHRVAYQTLVGPIPDGLVMDHVVARGCISPSCVNPAHLEPVTHKVNCSKERLTAESHAARVASGMRSGLGKIRAAQQRAKTHCSQGHEYAGHNLFLRRNGRRECRQCMKASQARIKARQV